MALISVAFVPLIFAGLLLGGCGQLAGQDAGADATVHDASDAPTPKDAMTADAPRESPGVDPCFLDYKTKSACETSPKCGLWCTWADWMPDGAFAGGCLDYAKEVAYDGATFPCPAGYKYGLFRCYHFAPDMPPEGGPVPATYGVGQCIPTQCYWEAGYPYDCPEAGAWLFADQ
jgi:hypothetical protein